MNVSQKKVIIIGGGISGLSVGYWLHKLGFSVNVLEKEKEVGGYVKSHLYEGYLVESGPNSTLNQYPEVRELCKDIGLEDEQVEGNPSSKKRYLVKNGKLIPLPMGVGQFINSPLWSLAGKMRIFKEPFVKRGGEEDESIESFFERRLGKEIVDYGLDPLVSGIYAGDPRELSIQSTFPRIHGLEQTYGSLIKGAIWKSLAETKKGPKGKIFSFKNGMGQMSKALEKKLNGSVKLEWEVKGFSYHPDSSPRVTVRGQYNGEKVSCDGDALILSTPAFFTADLFLPFSSALSNCLQKIFYAPICMVYLGLDRKAIEHPLDGFGCLIPEREGFELLGSLWNSTLFPNRSPQGFISMTNFLGGSRKPGVLDYPDERVKQVVLKELKHLVGLKGIPHFVKIIRYPRAIPQYQMGHKDRISQMEELLKPFPGIFLSGNYLRGVSVADCIQQGFQLAKKVGVFFQTDPVN